MRSDDEAPRTARERADAWRDGPGAWPLPPPGAATSLRAVLHGGLFGDPLLHLRHEQGRRSLLFDLGESAELPARLAHQVTDVFVTHCHADHFSGFLWLLRRRVGSTVPLRIHGPAGLVDRVRGFVDGLLWDRIGDSGPRFDVVEWDGRTVRRSRVQVGRGTAALGEEPGALVARGEGWRVRAEVLDHGVPVLAFRLEEDDRLAVRPDRLAEHGAEPGPWVGELKARALAGELDGAIVLPDGRRLPAAELAARLLVRTPGRILVYAADLAPHGDNRRRLVALARGAHTLVLEAAFCEADRARAVETHHLCARDCAAIAHEAGVRTLVPFHLSHRYRHDPAPVLRELRDAFPRLAVPLAVP